MDAILYHNACPDGWAAAFIASITYPEARLIPLDHGKSPEYIAELIESLRDKDVLMLDFSFRTVQENDLLASVTKSFHIYDHHETAKDKLAGKDYATFDMERSGAGLTWDYLRGKDSDRQFGVYTERPWWVNYVEVRDLWKWERLSNSREVNAYLGTLPFTVEAWSKLHSVSEGEAADKGRGALAQIDHYVREAIKRVQYGFYDGLRVAVLNVTYLMCSEVGNELAKTADFSLTWFEREDQTIQFSLRGNGKLKVNDIAKKFNGGGHPNAAGFQLPIEAGRQLIDLILGRFPEGRIADHLLSAAVPHS
jgi:oligoribonuclease NrnB/cAMP/cGMP phosphodiesterase (DHH superfamily)